ncbi:hypothetical protein [Niabella sp.]|uniref:hypothetical protein n=1 Tax=Niabella sp. TaxID=1962976 RepID=UPI0026197C95|nr:hypothetical protein [Niabella sp.]
MMSLSIEISCLILELRRLIERLESSKDKQLNFIEDEYWEVPLDKWSDFDKEPELIIGSLSDDYSLLKTISSAEGAFSFVEIDALIPILKALSKQWMSEL